MGRLRYLVAGVAVLALAGVAQTPSTAAVVAAGQARAQLGRVVPYIGIPGFGVGLGVAQADLSGRMASAQSASADFGNMSLFLNAIGGKAPVPPPDLPEPITARSDGAHDVENFPVAQPVTAGPAALTPGHEEAHASDEPAARAATRGPVLELQGVLSAGAVTSEAKAGKSESVSTISMGELRLGAPPAEVVLRDVTWWARQEMGHTAQGGFAIGSATVAGQPLDLGSPAQLTAGLEAVNTALAPAGLHLDAPVVTATEAGATVGPLVLQYRNPEAAAGLLGTAYKPAAPVVAQLFDALVAQIPETAAARLVANALISSATGRGGGRLELGGALARLGTVEFAAAPPVPLPSLAPPAFSPPPPELPAPEPSPSFELPAEPFTPVGGFADAPLPEAPAPVEAPPVAESVAIPDTGTRGPDRAPAPLLLGAGLGTVLLLSVRRRDLALRAGSLLLRGYAPLAGLVVVLLVVITVAPSRPFRSAAPAPGQSATALAEEASSPGALAAAAPSEATPTTGAGVAAISGGPAAQALGRSAGPARLSARPTTTARAATTPPTGRAQITPAANCSGGTLQDGNTPYSPPCLAWNGTDNGGATVRGVTADTIVVAVRESNQGGQRDEKQREEMRKRGLSDTPETLERIRHALLEYFNSHYQLYGRKVKLVNYKGRGSIQKEFGGGGQEEANADALKVGQEINAFADLSAISQPYLDALVRQKVVAFGGLHLPASYYQARAPYAYGQLIDCTTLVQSAVDLMVKRFRPGSLANRSGSAAMRQKPRTFGLLVPEDPVYQQCVNEGRPRFEAAGLEIKKEIHYALDFAKVQQEAPNMAAQLKEAGVTTVILVTDPLLPYFLTGAATQQDYWPEWFVTGTVLTDADVVGQFYDQDQWQFSYGLSFPADFVQGKDSESYRAYKSLRQDEPAVIRDLYYYSFLQLFIGLQMAGPNLTPETFRKGMFSYPGRSGTQGYWSWGPTDYTATDDAREIYYDRNAISPFNDKPGHWVTLNGGRRFRGPTWPVDVPPVPVPPAAAP